MVLGQSSSPSPPTRTNSRALCVTILSPIAREAELARRDYGRHAALRDRRRTAPQSPAWRDFPSSAPVLLRGATGRLEPAIGAVPRHFIGQRVLDRPEGQ